MEYSLDNLLYIENKKHKWFCGHYLRKKLGKDYCIVLSQAYEGENRFNGYCIGKNCNKRTWQLKYIYKKYKYTKLKKYVDISKNYQLLRSFDEKLISFSNSYYKGNKYGVQNYDNNIYQQKVNTWSYILFWNKVSELDRIK
jgi:hypothetical protein